MTTTDERVVKPEEPNGSLEKPNHGRSSWGMVAAWVVLLALLGLVAVGLKNTQEGPITPGDVVPNFTLTTFGGDQIQLVDLKGKVVVLNFWASWCKTCEQEAAELQTAWKFYEPRGDVVFLGADYVDTEPEALAYLQKFGITYPNGSDLGTRISQEFRIRGVPETYFIDKDGVLARAKIGPFENLNEIKTNVEMVLGE